MSLQFASTTPVDPPREDSGVPPLRPATANRIVTLLIVGLPTLGLVLGISQLWGGGPSVRTIVIAIVLYVITGHGVTVGYHRLLTHKSFVASRPLKLVLLSFGSMAFEGGPIGWVATHREHHVFADTVGDPHSPRRQGGTIDELKGLVHAHVGWLFTFQSRYQRRHARDLIADRDVVVINALFPMWCVVSLAVPFGLGWLIGGTLAAALEALLWAGLVRICLLHHTTWSVNSLCHAYGRRSFATDDLSTNLGWLAVLSMGESFHNAHHAFPRSARHGMTWRQIDTSWLLIRLFRRAGWARGVHAPTPAAVASGGILGHQPWTGGPIYRRTPDR